MQVSNNTVLLTGGTSGIGFELLRQLYRLNNRMIVTSSNEKNLANIKKQFSDIQPLFVIKVTIPQLGS